jgi:hypothetical protein
MSRSMTAMLMLASTQAVAGPFAEVGVSQVISDGCVKDFDERAKQWGCSDNPLGSVAIGWQHKGLAIQAEHMSSLVEKDKGLNVISIKYRYEFFKD